MAFRISVTRRAELDAQEIFSWLLLYSFQGAESWFSHYLNAVASLSTFPERGGIAEESLKPGDHVRQIFFKTSAGRNYRLLYSVCGDEVVIMHVRGPGQKLLDDPGETMP